MSDETALVTEEDIRKDVAPVVSAASELIVRTAENYTAASDFLKSIKAAQKKVTDFFAPIKSATHSAWKKTTAGEATLLTPLTDAESTVKRKMIDYANAEEALRIAEQKRLQAEADEVARRERERLEKAAARLKTPEKAAEKMEAAAMIVAPVVEVASARPVVAGQSIRKVWRARVIDAELIPRQWMTVNEKALEAFVRATGGSVPVAGVEWYQESVMSSSSK